MGGTRIFWGGLRGGPVFSQWAKGGDHYILIALGVGENVVKSTGIGSTDKK